MLLTALFAELRKGLSLYKAQALGGSQSRTYTAVVPMPIVVSLLARSCARGYHHFDFWLRETGLNLIGIVLKVCRLQSFVVLWVQLDLIGSK